MQTFSPVDIKLIVKLQDALGKLEELRASSASRGLIQTEATFCDDLRLAIRKQMNAVDDHTVTINALRNQGYRTE